MNWRPIGTFTLSLSAKTFSLYLFLFTNIVFGLFARWTHEIKTKSVGILPSVPPAIINCGYTCSRQLCALRAQHQTPVKVRVVEVKHLKCSCRYGWDVAINSGYYLSHQIAFSRKHWSQPWQNKPSPNFGGSCRGRSRQVKKKWQENVKMRDVPQTDWGVRAVPAAQVPCVFMSGWASQPQVTTLESWRCPSSFVNAL